MRTSAPSRRARLLALAPAVLVPTALLCGSAEAVPRPGAPATASVEPLPAAGPAVSTVPRHVAGTGAEAAWQRGNRGRGVAIAVLDTGVTPTPDLAGRLVVGPDLSEEGGGRDSYGHGTVMAGLVAGNGRSSSGTHAGVAPEATVVAVKAAGRTGAVDVATVLRGLQWVSEHAEEHGIRVLNLSWGVPPTADPGRGPLDVAVERLWEQGVVVVAGAGNAGPGPGTVTSPADNPVVLSVGALDDEGDADPANDAVADWSSRGPTADGAAKPDVVAPGRSLVAARSVGSAAESDHPDALVAPSYITSSGTSQAAAVTSGLAALLLADRPSLTPDQVKELLVRTATPVPGGEGGVAEARRVALDRALDAEPTLAGSRRTGSTRAVAPAHPLQRSGSTWSGSTWSGSTWSGSTWSGRGWGDATSPA